MKILVTGAGALLGQGIIASIRRSTLEATVIAVDPSPLSAGLYWADGAHLVPMAHAPQYRDAIWRILECEKPDVVLVGTDVELAFFAENRTVLEREFSTHIVVSPPSVIAIADDKWLTAEFLRNAGFPHPDSALLDGVDSLIRRVGFPLVVKPRVGARSVGVSVVRDRAELARALSAVHDPVVQQHLGSPLEEYTAGVLVFGGEAKASIVLRRDLRDGNTYRAYSGEFNEMNAAVRSIAEAFEGYGPLNFQFRVHDGKPVVFEVNGRFSGTTPLRALCGFNEVEMVVRHVVRGEPILQPSVKELVVMRYWAEVAVEPWRLVGSRGL